MDEAILDKDGTIRCKKTLQLLGHWFKVGDIYYRIMIILILSIGLAGNAQIPKDKKLHYAVGFGLGALTQGIAQQQGLKMWEGLLINAITSIGYGAFKEHLDTTKKGGKIDMNDVWAGSLGALSGGLVVGITIEIF